MQRNDASEEYYFHYFLIEISIKCTKRTLSRKRDCIILLCITDSVLGVRTISDDVFTETKVQVDMSSIIPVCNTSTIVMRSLCDIYIIYIYMYNVIK